MPTPPVLELQDVTTKLSVDGHLQTVLRAVNLSIGRGEIVGLVGESGSGKSMTARTIVRSLPKGAVSEGAILLEGRDVLSASKRQLRRIRALYLAMVFQDPRAHVDPLWRVGDYLLEAVQLAGRVRRSAARTRALELLESVAIDEPERRLHQYPGELSGGLLQRVTIAAALAQDPKLLIADEPTTALDVTTQAEIAALLSDLRRSRSLSVLFITHDLALAAQLCDRILVMYAGRIVESGSSNDLFEASHHPYTRALLAARPSVDERKPRLAVIPGQPASAFQLTAGCTFQPRCPFAIARCAAEEPPLAEIESGLSACWRASELTTLADAC